ncbi:MAG: hypothetical protein U1A27_14325 [Phycisphaerae bacterium]
MPTPPAPIGSAAALERDRLRVVLATVALNILAVGMFALLPHSDWRTGVLLNSLDNALLLAFVLARRDARLGLLMLCGAAAGLVELAADAWLVDATRTLDYSIGGGPMVWHSPAWMPLAWEVVFVQFACIGKRLIDAAGVPAGVTLTGLLGALNIPYYEEMARYARWWRYDQCRRLLHTPYYIIAGEFVIAAGFAWLGARLLRGPVRPRRSAGATLARALLAGALGGALIYAAYAGAWWLIERPR